MGRNGTQTQFDGHDFGSCHRSRHINAGAQDDPKPRRGGVALSSRLAVNLEGRRKSLGRVQRVAAEVEKGEGGEGRGRGGGWRVKAGRVGGGKIFGMSGRRTFSGLRVQQYLTSIARSAARGPRCLRETSQAVTWEIISDTLKGNEHRGQLAASSAGCWPSSSIFYTLYFPKQNIFPIRY
jgi:hypothetical protein